MSRAVKIVVLSLILLTGVGVAVHLSWGRDETRREVAQRYTSELTAVGEDLRALAAFMPSGRIDTSECPGLEPGQRPFRYSRQGAQPDNLEFVMQEGLTDPAREPKHLEPVSSQLTDLVSITGTGPDPDEADWYDQPAPSDFAERVEELTHVKYVAVVRVVELQSPEVTGDGVRGGYMAMEVVILDLRARTILCTATAEAGVTEATYFVSEGDTAEERREQARMALESRLSTAAEDALERALTDLDRGTFSGL